jgi:hypothetical protein
MTTWSVVVLATKGTWTHTRIVLAPTFTRVVAMFWSVRAQVMAGWERHTEKLAADPAYGRTLVEALSAVVRTVVRRTGVAAAIVVFLSSMIVPVLEDESEPYRGSRPWTPRAQPRPQPLWDRFGEDD